MSLQCGCCHLKLTAAKGSASELTQVAAGRGLPGGPLTPGQLAFPGARDLGNSETYCWPRWKSRVFYNLIPEVTYHPFCCVQFRRGSLGTISEAAFRRFQIHLKPWSSVAGSEANRKCLKVIVGPEPEPTSHPVSRFCPLLTFSPSTEYVQLAVAKYVPQFLAVATLQWHPTPSQFNTIKQPVTKFLCVLRTAAGDYSEQDGDAPALTEPLQTWRPLTPGLGSGRFRVPPADTGFFPTTLQNGERAYTIYCTLVICDTYCVTVFDRWNLSLT